MPRETNKLTPLKIAALKPMAKDRKVFDGQGLYILVRANGSKLWQMKYRLEDGRPQTLSFGPFPEVTLAEARNRRTEARAQRRTGADPMALKKAAKAAKKREADGGFAPFAERWLATAKKTHSAGTHKNATNAVMNHLIPRLRHTSVTTLTLSDAAKALKAIAGDAENVATKARQYLQRIIQHAIHEGLRDEDRTLDLRGVLARFDKGHIPAATTAAEIRPLVLALEKVPTPVTRDALRLLMWTCVRPSEVVGATWSEVDLDRAEWTIPASRMKGRTMHIVSLPDQAVKMLKELHLLTGGGDWVFPAQAKQKTPHLHRDSLSSALRDLGFEGKHSPHGFRAMLRTYGRETLGFPEDVLEAQLAHAKKTAVQKAYDRTGFIAERRVAMQAWADHLDVLKTGGNVVPMRAWKKAGNAPL